MEKEKSIFQTLAELDMTSKHREKNKMTYLPWASAWAAVKSVYPEATWSVIKSPEGNNYWTDGKTCHVETTVSINGLTQEETLAVMDFKNQSVPLANINSTTVDKSIRRCLTKNLALFGLDLNLWVGEELSDEAKEKISNEEAEAKQQLAEKIKEVVESGTALIKSGVTKSDMMTIVANNNGGNGNPSSIKDLETCEKILKEFKKYKKKDKEVDKK